MDTTPPLSDRAPGPTSSPAAASDTPTLSHAGPQADHDGADVSRKVIASIQGRPGSFHHIVAGRLFGDSVDCLYRGSFREVMADVHQGRASHAIMAIENSIAGSLILNYDLLANHPVPIAGEVFLRIGQHLIGWPGTSLEEISEVWSHPMAIEQCREFLDTHPDWRVFEQEDTAGSLERMKASGRRDVAVIASDYSAQLHHMQILREHVETDPQNYTRFLVMSRQPLPPHLDARPARITFRFSTLNRPGSLLRVLEVFDRLGLNLSKLESRPLVGTPWQYQFFCDTVVDPEVFGRPEFDALLERLGEVTHQVVHLGSYPDWSAIDMRAPQPAPISSGDGPR